MSILSRVETIQKHDSLPPIVVLIEGKPKTGKTTAALTWPRPLLIDFPTEDGATLYPGTKRVMMKTWADVEGLPAELSKSKDFDTVVIDTLQAMWGMLTEHRKLELQEYGGFYAKFAAALNSFTSTGKHVVLVSHTKDEYETLIDSKGKSYDQLKRSVAMLPGQLAERVAGFAEQILHTYVNDFGAIYIRCKGGDKKEAGGRLRALPDFFEWKAGSNVFAGLQKAYSQQNEQKEGK